MKKNSYNRKQLTVKALVDFSAKNAGFLVVKKITENVSNKWNSLCSLYKALDKASLIVGNLWMKVQHQEQQRKEDSRIVGLVKPLVSDPIIPYTEVGTIAIHILKQINLTRFSSKIAMVFMDKIYYRNRSLIKYIVLKVSEQSVLQVTPQLARKHGMAMEVLKLVKSKHIIWTFNRNLFQTSAGVIFFSISHFIL